MQLFGKSYVNIYRVSIYLYNTIRHYYVPTLNIFTKQSGSWDFRYKYIRIHLLRNCLNIHWN